MAANSDGGHGSRFWKRKLLSLGELIGPRTHRWVVRKIICAGATMLLVLTSAIWFGIIASSFGTINADVVAYGSLALLIFTIISSGGCVALSEV